MMIDSYHGRLFVFQTRSIVLLKEVASRLAGLLVNKLTALVISAQGQGNCYAMYLRYVTLNCVIILDIWKLCDQFALLTRWLNKG